ncbi:MAG: SAM-dependent methyltransferase [Gammaproteobacteria bacterium]|nr:SAM-dependent methyltransferase [Gammaproteobacteria bacterium]
MNKDQLQQWLQEQIDNCDIIKLVLSKPAERLKAAKISCEPVLIKDAVKYQCATQIAAQVMQENLKPESVVERIMLEFPSNFGQLLVKTRLEDRNFYANKEGVIGVNTQKHKVALTQKLSTQNRKKQYLLAEGIPAPFLIELGIMTAEGKVRTQKYDKFKQINRYLEMIADCLEDLPKDHPIKIIDFGCGKSYLTFAVHYFFTELQRREVTIIGLDLKAEVIEDCSRIAKKLNCIGLSFQVGDIAQFNAMDKVDMVISLHACDTATDYALAKAVAWEAKIILAVPCCHKELASQLSSDVLKPILAYGIVKERMAALVTDALRAELLKSVGYKVQLLEFIDLENTPKNILIRAVRQQVLEKESHAFEHCCQALHVAPLLKTLLS